MGEKKRTYIDIDDAVARLVNLDYIPPGLSVLDMTAAFKEEAEVEYENGVIAGLAEDELLAMERRLDTCNARHELAQSVLAGIKNDLLGTCGGEGHISANDTKNVDLQALQHWAADRFGIGVPSSPDTRESKQRWEDITIKIYAEYRIGWQVDQRRWVRSSFDQMGLQIKGANRPNKQGNILIGLAAGKKFPSGSIKAKDKTAISRLRDALKRLTGISSDPFKAHNSADGWRPRFTLIDDRRNADERAKARARHVPYDETRDYEAEGDDADQWLKNR